MKTIILLIISSLFFCGILYSQNDIVTSGYLRNYSGVLTKSPNEFSIVQNTFNLELQKHSDKVAFKFNPYVHNYLDKSFDFGIREAYLDLYFNKFDIRIGKQQIIWGKSDGVFITDVISPKDLSEFLLPDFSEIRTGVTSLKFNYFTENHTLEAVWIPVFTPTKMPESNSIWAPQIDFPINPLWDYSNAEVKPCLENSEAFLRYSLMASKFDLELVGGYFYYDDPALHISKTYDPMLMQITSLTIRPEYHRVGMAGGSLSLPIGPIVFRTEGAYYTGRNFQSVNPLYNDATVSKDNLHYLAGIDYNLWGIKLSAQFIQEFIINYEDGISNDEFENTMTFLAKKDFFREKLWIELFAYIGLNSEDALIRPKVSYAFADGFEILAGANIFVGESGRFGQYNNNDNVYMKLKYSF